jgi:hypothetical protein
MRSNKNTVIIAAIAVVFALPCTSVAQVCHKLYPSPEVATYDNGGQDLRGFITTNKKDLLYKGAKVNDFSKNTWGYLQVKTVRVPSVGKDQKLNYTEYINATLAMYKTKNGAQATWWARQCNNPKGPLVDARMDSLGNRLDMEYTRNNIIFNDLSTKQFTLVEYSDEGYNHKDYDDLLKNYIMAENGIVEDMSDYGAIVDYYNNFASKFSDITDPLLEYKSFITFFTTGKGKYVGYFNVVNNKLAGRLEKVGITYNRDKDTFVTHVFRKLTGSVVYVYGDEIFDLDLTINTYAREHNVKVIRRKTTTGKDFNKDIHIHQPQ